MSNIFIKGFSVTPKDGGYEIVEFQNIINQDIIEEKPNARGEDIKRELINRYKQDVINNSGSVE